MTRLCAAETSHSFENFLGRKCQLPENHSSKLHKWTHSSGTFSVTWPDVCRVDAAIAALIVGETQ